MAKKIMHGTTLQGATSGLVGKLTKVPIPGGERDEIETSNNDSANTATEWSPGMFTQGADSFELNFDESTFDNLVTALTADEEAWTVTFPNGGTFVCQGFMRSLKGQGATKEKGSVTILLRWTGVGTYTAPV